jgi:hypothetical protein
MSSLTARPLAHKLRDCYRFKCLSYYLIELQSKLDDRAMSMEESPQSGTSRCVCLLELITDSESASRQKEVDGQ